MKDKFKKKTGKKWPRISAKKIKLLGLMCSSFAEAESQIDMDLTRYLAKYKTMDNAWKRGRFLRELRELAMYGAKPEEVAERLKLEGNDAFEKLIAKDTEAADLWRQSQNETFVKLKAALFELAISGNQAAIKAIEGIIRDQARIKSTEQNYHHISSRQLCEILGTSRQNIHYWRTRCGLAINLDGTYDLAVFFEWFKQFCESKAPKANDNDRPADPLKAAKAERLAMEIKHRRNELLDRDEVMAGLLARHQVLISWITHRPGDLGRLCQGQKAERIEELIKTSLNELRNDLCRVPAELQLPIETKSLFEKTLESMK